MFWDDTDFFGGMFDFNGDGHTDFVEMALGFQILDEMDREADDDKNSEDEDASDESSP